VYNVACGVQTSLNDLWKNIRKITSSNIQATYGSKRPGDVKHSLADISKARNLLKYDPPVLIKEGLKRTDAWFNAFAE